MQAMTSKGSAQVTLPADDQILITREFAAPRELVYKAWTTPELVAGWWNAGRGEMTHCEIDLRVGGRWRYAMVAMDGEVVAFNGEFREIVPNERIVSTEAYEGAPGSEPSLNTATFTDLGEGRSRLEVVMQLTDQAMRDAIIATGMESGLQDALDLLEELVVAQR